MFIMYGYKLPEWQSMPILSIVLLTNSSFCNSCSSGYYLNSSNSCQRCEAPCITCSSSITSCSACNNGYYLQTNTCSLRSNYCTSCTDGTSCTTCSNNYSYNLSNRAFMSVNCKYSSCKKFKSDFSSCGICADGYILSSSACTACPNGCLKC